MKDHRRSRRRRWLLLLPYALLVLAGIGCVLLIAVTGQQVLGWQTGFRIDSQLNVDYESNPDQLVAPVNATIIARLQATDEAQLTLTLTPRPIETQAPLTPTPTGTIQIAQVTDTPPPTFTRTPTHTHTPTQTPTRTATPTSTNTPLPTPTFTASNTPSATATPIPPTPTNTNPPPQPSNTPTNTNPPPAPTDTFTPTPITPTNTPVTPSPTTNPAPPPPLTLTVVNTSDTLVSLVWTNESASDSDFVQYRLFRSYNSGGPYTTTVGTTAGTAYVDTTGLTSGTTYYYIVRGEDTIQSSGNSPEAFGVPGPIGDPIPDPGGCVLPAPPDCMDVLALDGFATEIYASAGHILTLDMGPNNGIMDDTGPDLVYYEVVGLPNFVAMDWINIELSMDNINWYTVFAWSLGAETSAQSGNVAPFALGGTDCDVLPGATQDEDIRMDIGGCSNWNGLYGVTPLQTGISIDIGSASPPIPAPTGEGYRYIRITVRPDADSGGPNPTEVDYIERLN